MSPTRFSTQQLIAAQPAIVESLDELVGAEERAQLLEAILASEASDLHPTKDRRRSRRQTRVVAVMVVVAAAAVVATTLIVRPGLGRSKPIASTAAATQLVGYVTSAVEDANEVVVIDSTNDGVESTFWALTKAGDTTRWRYSIDGQPSYDQTIVSGNGKLSITNVDFAAHAWWTEEDLAPACSQSPCQAFGPTPSQVVQGLNSGQFQIAGHPVLDGQPTIELTATYPGMSGSDDLFVDAQTFLPLKDINSINTSPFTTTYSYLPLTAANKALLQVPIPAGFRHLDHPISCDPSQLPPHGTTDGCP